MLDVPFRFSCISYEKSAYSQDLWSIWPQLALAPNYHGKARADLLRREHHYMQSPFISLLLCSQAAMDGAAACLETQFTSRTQYFYLDGLLGFLLGNVHKWWVKIGHNIIDAWTEMGQNLIRGEGRGSKNPLKIGHHLCMCPYDPAYISHILNVQIVMVLNWF